MPGPAPDPNALRRSRKDDAAWSSLPLALRTEPAPKWPLSRATTRERKLWVELWAKPQAAIWAHNRQELEVALYVRSFAEAELPAAQVTLRALVARQADALLLTAPAMARARIRIAPDEMAERRDLPAVGPRRLTARERAAAADVEAV